MQTDDRDDALDRHALVLAVWLPAAALAGLAFHLGFGMAGAAWLGAGFGAVIAGFAAHVIINAVTGSHFTPREVALALVVTLAGLMAHVAAILFAPGYADRFFLPVSSGLAVLVAVLVFYLVTSWGPRRAFETFDVIRDNNRRAASRLSHRGGRK